MAYNTQIRLEDALHTLIHSITTVDVIRAIAQSGGNEPLPQPGQGDIDLFLYCTDLPTPDQRRQTLETIPSGIEQIQVGMLNSTHWGQGDCLQLWGVETWLIYFRIPETLQELEALLAGSYPDRADSYYYPIGRCAMWREMQMLYDPDGLLHTIQARVKDYPAALANRLTAHHRKHLHDTENLERAVLRGDVLFYHFALDLALDHFLQALFAINQTYFPSRKRSLQWIASFACIPVDCAQRLLRVVALGNAAATLAESLQLWLVLVLIAGLDALVQAISSAKRGESYEASPFVPSGERSRV